MTNVKWLERITLVAEPVAGYHHARGYRLRASEDDEGTVVSRMQPRSLLVPPGIPEFLTRERTLEAGDHALEGRAWSGGCSRQSRRGTSAGTRTTRSSGSA